MSLNYTIPFLEGGVHYFFLLLNGPFSSYVTYCSWAWLNSRGGLMYVGKRVFCSVTMIILLYFKRNLVMTAGLGTLAHCGQEFKIPLSFVLSDIPNLQQEIWAWHVRSYLLKESNFVFYCMCPCVHAHTCTRAHMYTRTHTYMHRRTHALSPFMENCLNLILVLSGEGEESRHRPSCVWLSALKIHPAGALISPSSTKWRKSWMSLFFSGS